MLQRIRAARRGSRAMTLQPLLGRERELTAIEELLRRRWRGRRHAACAGRGRDRQDSAARLAALRAEELGLSVLSTAGVPSKRRWRTPACTGSFARTSRGSASFPGRSEMPCHWRSASMRAAPRPAASHHRHRTSSSIALAALDLLAETAPSTPVLLIVEDAHWLDVDNVRGACVRCQAGRGRADRRSLRGARQARRPTRGSPAPRAPFQRLDENDSDSFSTSTRRRCLARDARRRLLDTAGGNPLALMELPHTIATELGRRFTGGRRRSPSPSDWSARSRSVCPVFPSHAAICSSSRPRRGRRVDRATHRGRGRRRSRCDAGRSLAC